jgi:hypothetical protein
MSITPGNPGDPEAAQGGNGVDGNRSRCLVPGGPDASVLRPTCRRPTREGSVGGTEPGKRISRLDIPRTREYDPFKQGRAAGIQRTRISVESKFRESASAD